MPFRTACGHQNPDDANFCSQCGTAEARGRASLRQRPLRPSRWRPVKEPAEEPLPTRCHGVDALPPAPRCSWYNGADLRDLGSCSTPTGHGWAATRAMTSSWTTSPCRASTRSSAGGPRGLLGPRRRQSQRHLRQPRADRGRCRCRAATRSRSASTACSTSRATRARRLERAPTAAGPGEGRLLDDQLMNIGEVLAQLRQDFPDVRIPRSATRGRRPGRADPHRVRLPQVHQGRCGEAALRAVDGAGLRAAAQAHQGPPRPDGPRARAARRCPANRRCLESRSARTGCRPPRASGPTVRRFACPGASCSRRPRWTTSC